MCYWLELVCKIFTIWKIRSHLTGKNLNWREPPTCTTISWRSHAHGVTHPMIRIPWPDNRAKSDANNGDCQSLSYYMYATVKTVRAWPVLYCSFSQWQYHNINYSCESIFNYELGGGGGGERRGRRRRRTEHAAAAAAWGSRRSSSSRRIRGRAAGIRRARRRRRRCRSVGEETGG